MKEIRMLVVLTCAAALFAAGCGKKKRQSQQAKKDTAQEAAAQPDETEPAKPPPSKPSPPEVSAADLDAVVDGNNKFALDLFAHISSGRDNLFFSPVSISTALAMTYGGAGGKTEAEMRKVLHFALKEEKLHQAFAALAGKMESKENRLSVANRLWGQKGLKFHEAFLTLTSQYYGAELQQLDFKNATEAARKTINAWVEEKTEDKIIELIKPGLLGSLTFLVLTNAIYFKGAWESKFDEKHTKDAFFTPLEGKKVKVPMMHQEEDINYASVDDLQILEMPYAGEEMSMVVLLPGQSSSLDNLEKSLTWENLNTWLSALQKQKVEVFLPSFKMTSGFLLGDALRSMGMESPFSAKDADFSGIADAEVFFLSEVIHKAYVDVNEEGTEAAAATAVMVKGAKPPGQPPVFRADRPFLFLIMEKSSGSILFIGRLANPADKT